MTYADECLYRAEEATIGPWETYKTSDADCSDGVTCENGIIVGGSIDYEQSGIDTEASAEFIAHARQDVPELARRLKKAIAKLKSQVGQYDIPYHEELVKELEAPL